MAERLRFRRVAGDGALDLSEDCLADLVERTHGAWAGLRFLSPLELEGGNGHTC